MPFDCCKNCQPPLNIRCTMCCKTTAFIEYIAYTAHIQNTFEEFVNRVSIASVDEVSGQGYIRSSSRDLNPLARSILDESDIINVEKADLQELLRITKELTAWVDLPSHQKEIALEQIDLLSTISLDTDEVEISKEVEVALLILQGISSTPPYLP